MLFSNENYNFNGEMIINSACSECLVGRVMDDFVYSLSASKS